MIQSERRPIDRYPHMVRCWLDGWASTILRWPATESDPSYATAKSLYTGQTGTVQVGPRGLAGASMHLARALRYCRHTVSLEDSRSIHIVRFRRSPA